MLVRVKGVTARIFELLWAIESARMWGIFV